MSDPSIRVRLDRTPFESFLDLPVNGALDFLMECGEQPNLLVDWLRGARTDREMLSIHAVLSQYFDDLALPFLDCRYVAALAAGALDGDRVRAILTRLPISGDDIALALTKVRRDWHAPHGWEGSAPYMLAVVERLITAGADPTRVRQWIPFVHPADVGLKTRAARIILSSAAITPASLSRWLTGSALTREDAQIIHAEWRLRTSPQRQARAAETGRFEPASPDA